MLPTGMPLSHSGNPASFGAFVSPMRPALRFGAVLSSVDSAFSFLKRSAPSEDTASFRTDQVVRKTGLKNHLPTTATIARHKVHTLIASLLNLPFNPQLVGVNKLDDINHALKHIFNVNGISKAARIKSRGFYNYYVFKQGRTSPDKFQLYDADDYTQTRWGIKRGSALMVYDPLEKSLTFYSGSKSGRDFRLGHVNKERRAFGTLGMTIKRIELADSVLAPLCASLEEMLSQANAFLLEK